MVSRKNLKDKVYQTSQWLELVISIVITLVIIFYTAALVYEGIVLVTGGESKIANLSDFINVGFGLVIGIEFIKMLCKHSPSIIVEVLMFAVARQMIVEHMSPIQNLCCIACIGLLFGIRRFLFFPYDDAEHMEFVPSEKASKVCKLMGVNIPIDNKNDTLYDVFCRHCESENIAKGVCVYFQGCALRVASMMGEHISLIEVVRSATNDVMVKH